LNAHDLRHPLPGALASQLLLLDNGIEALQVGLGRLARDLRRLLHEFGEGLGEARNDCRERHLDGARHGFLSLALDCLQVSKLLASS